MDAFTVGWGVFVVAAWVGVPTWAAWCLTDWKRTMPKPKPKRPYRIPRHIRATADILLMASRAVQFDCLTPWLEGGPKVPETPVKRRRKP